MKLSIKEALLGCNAETWPHDVTDWSSAQLDRFAVNYISFMSEEEKVEWKEIMHDVIDELDLETLTLEDVYRKCVRDNRQLALAVNDWMSINSIPIMHHGV